jgi:hypothetical protein
MAGTVASGRPGGNPDLKKFQFSTDNEESNTALLAVRIAPSQLEKLKAIKDWQDILREKIREILAES